MATATALIDILYGSSLRALSPFSPIPRDHLLVVTKSYFDCALRPAAVSVATVSGTISQWDRFDKSWSAVVAKHGAGFLHTTDAVALKEDFREGWTDDSVDAFIWDCVSVIDDCILKPSPIPGIPLRDGLMAVTLTIGLEDYRRARGRNNTLPNNIYDVLATETASFAFKWGKHIGANWYHLYYDQGESLCGHIRTRMRNRKVVRDVPILKKIANIAEPNMRVTPALQMADLFAWCISHNDRVLRSWHKRLHGLQWNSLDLPYELLIRPMKGVFERTAKWKLPVRARFPKDAL